MRAVVRALVAVPVVVVASLGSLSVVAPTAGAAPCLDCPGDPPPSYDHVATTTISKPSNVALSISPGALTCASGTTSCTIQDDKVTAVPSWPATGWTTYTLSITSPQPGYTAFWTGCDNVSGAQCTVANNQQSRSVSLSLADVTAPSTPVLNAPDKVGAATAITASSSDTTNGAVLYVWTVDGSPLSFTGTGISLAAYDAGAHTVSVQAKDAAGNVSAAATKTVTLDKSTSLAVGDTPAVTRQDFPWSFTPDSDVPNDAAHRSCDIDGLGWGACTGATSWLVPTSGLDEGSHVLSVRATDDVGNVATIARTVVVDRTAPVVQITSGPAEGASVTTSAIALTFSVSDANPGSITCRFDAVSAPCGTSPNNLTVGQHAFAVTATDKAGNATTVTRHFSVARTRTSLTAHPSKARTAKGHRVTLVARVSPSAATGTVTFKQSTKVLCRGAVRTGVAHCATGTALARGLHRVRATYAGSSRYLPASASTSFRIV